MLGFSSFRLPCAPRRRSSGRPKPLGRLRDRPPQPSERASRQFKRAPNGTTGMQCGLQRAPWRPKMAPRHPPKHSKS
eukprot:5498591-Pyramimonas_sp.AAC.1